MKTKLITTLAIAVFCSVILTAQTEKTMEKFKPEIRDVNEIHMIYYDFTGPYDQSFNAFGELMQFIQTNQLPMGPQSLGIFYDDPEKVPANELRSEIGFMLTKAVEGTDKYKYKKIEATKAVSVRYTSMDDIYPAYTAISNYIIENNLNTAPYSIEIYYSADPNVVDAEILMLIKD